MKEKVGFATFTLCLRCPGAAEPRARALGNTERVKGGEMSHHKHRHADFTHCKGDQWSRTKGAEKGKGFFHAK